MEVLPRNDSKRENVVRFVVHLKKKNDLQESL